MKIVFISRRWKFSTWTPQAQRGDSGGIFLLWSWQTKIIIHFISQNINFVWSPATIIKMSRLTVDNDHDESTHRWQLPRWVTSREKMTKRSWLTGVNDPDKSTHRWQWPTWVDSPVTTTNNQARPNHDSDFRESQPTCIKVLSYWCHLHIWKVTPRCRIHQ